MMQMAYCPLGYWETAVAHQRCITLRGVAVHNLKEIDLDLPYRRLIVLCGPSGSGKTSLALDTLYAEGQRRYIDSFSAYTRQFLERLEKPAAERIDGIPPAIAVTLSPAVESDGTRVAPVTAHFTCTDERSGVATCPPDQVLLAPGTHQIVTGTVTDRAGNSATVTTSVNVERPSMKAKPRTSPTERIHKTRAPMNDTASAERIVR